MSERFLPRRLLGRTGFVATRLGAGDLADRAVPLEACVATLRRALDAGLNVVDTAPSYEDGYSEELVGAALAGRREGVFLIDKVDHHDRPVGPQVAASLARLRLPAVDLLVFHGVSEVGAWRALASPGGGMAALAAEVAAGRARFRGISSHDPGALLEAIPSGLCDVVMFPIGPWVDRRYEREVLPLARACGVGTVCFKTFGAGKLLADTEGYQRPLQARPRGKVSSGGGAPTRDLPHLEVEECVHYTLTVDPDVALLGLSFENEQDQAFAAARAFRGPLPEARMAALRARAAEAIRDKGRVWWNPPPPAIRLATLADAEALAGVQVAAWHAAYRGLMPDALLDGFTVEVRAPRWRELLGAPAAEARTWVVEAGPGTVLGFLSTGPTRDADRDGARTAEVYALYLVPEQVGRGLGRALMDHALADLRARGASTVDLWVLDGNARAERFYARAGFAAGLREVKTVQGAALPHTRWSTTLAGEG